MIFLQFGLFVFEFLDVCFLLMGDEMKVSLFLCVTVFFSGCAVFTERKANPVIVNRTSSEGKFVETLSTTAERRLVLIKHLGTDEIAKIKAQDPDAFVSDTVFCAEPSPDSLEAVAASFGGNASNTSGQVSQEVAFEKSLVTSAALATKRSQGLQFYRDTIFGLCQARMNGFMGNRELATQLKFARMEAASMIKEELKTSGFNSAPQVNVSIAPSKKEP
ncbi:hypothetical protein TRM7557_01309 [Tritonibacter multivorans]|uniref:Uncharacterized protein n=1 Tax=Tritonibacter multivorans TaxID=928856 RepID=A0A0P1GN49_9RHOB|nr:hypothetical protein [Tritonibacter multivorans]MDA7422807.1 hypothetical protein [Tritonibacter multivorans]CUH77307.1 hypothetical protein TRM7557_01309 [Tritonibacter multivorans]SFD59232.1 hypothetical protein SAMN04488049_11722 [Tritonibacter multivorans]